MKIKIRNFGPINTYDFDLDKDLHLIVGENSVGKSYAITAVYLIIKSIINISEIIYFPIMLKKLAMSIDHSSIFKCVNNEKITSQAESSLKILVNEYFVLQLQDSFAATFDSLSNLQNQFTKEPFNIVIDTDLLFIKIVLMDKLLSIDELKIKKSVKLRIINQNRSHKILENEIIVYCIKDEKESIKVHFAQFLHEIFSGFIKEVCREVKSVHYLPASRSGLYQALSAFGQIIAELSKSRAFLTKKVELPGISEPLSDYFLKLSEINVNQKSIEQNKLDIIAKRIEVEILKGKVEYDSKTKRIIYTPNSTNLKLDLSSTSSMVSELSPIVSYLRYVLSQTERKSRFNRMYESNPSSKPLVIIEEPEAHLHPEVQIKLMDVFADLVANGVKMMITSHSNYIFNKTNNLILENKIDINKLQASIFRKKELGSYCEFLPTDELGIDDENFIDSSELLYDEKIKLIKMFNGNV